ncbi:hypothetical protein MtrunA17_Chr4g0006331 [Medicago truncatula]|uniref:Uncharacterized protein n=1 Tax=Medicago truncatula TaxID=3880 RepID=A0A396I248_MEDTR|nr:hypothetical protein MtrunA17_Chr4g0006331 [Medicago truncatula]
MNLELITSGTSYGILQERRLPQESLFGIERCYSIFLFDFLPLSRVQVKVLW